MDLLIELCASNGTYYNVTFNLFTTQLPPHTVISEDPYDINGFEFYPSESPNAEDFYLSTYQNPGFNGTLDVAQMVSAAVSESLSSKSDSLIFLHLLGAVEDAIGYIIVNQTLVPSSK